MPLPCLSLRLHFRVWFCWAVLPMCPTHTPLAFSSGHLVEHPTHGELCINTGLELLHHSSGVLVRMVAFLLSSDKQVCLDNHRVAILSLSKNLDIRHGFYFFFLGGGAYLLSWKWKWLGYNFLFCCDAFLFFPIAHSKEKYCFPFLDFCKKEF